MLDALNLPHLSFEASYKDSTGRHFPCFHLPRDLTETLVTGYNARLRLAVVRHPRELKA